MTTFAPPDGSGDVPGSAVDPEAAEISRRYREAIGVFQRHHDNPGTTSEDDLAAALRPYLQRWDRRMRQNAYRYGFTTDDVGIVTQTASTEFFFDKIVTGQFDPAKNEFSIFQTLIIQRAIDHQRRRQTNKENFNIEGLHRLKWTNPTGADDPYAGAHPAPSAEDIAMDAMTLEEAAKQLCADAGLDARETAIVTYRYVHEITDWPAATELINAELPPPVSWKTLRNICRAARKKIQIHLDNRLREEDF
jgi:hypothetical protein